MRPPFGPFMVDTRPQGRCKPARLVAAALPVKQRYSVSKYYISQCKKKNNIVGVFSARQDTCPHCPLKLPCLQVVN